MRSKVMSKKSSKNCVKEVDSFVEAVSIYRAWLARYGSASNGEDTSWPEFPTKHEAGEVASKDPSREGGGAEEG